MSESNCFLGKGQKSKYTAIIYNLLMSGREFSYADIFRHDPDWDGDEQTPLSKREGYGECKKAFLWLTGQLGKEVIKKNGNNKQQTYRYVGVDNDPLKSLREEKSRDDLRRFVQFCVESAGFFPFSWVEHYFQDDRELLEIKHRKEKGKEAISSSLNHSLTNIELLPFLHEAIVNRQVLTIKYNVKYEEVLTLTFHPQYLKEFNLRWFLFGYVEEDVPDAPHQGFNIAIDRIQGRPRYCHGKEYIPAATDYYKNFFNDIYGVGINPNSKPEDVVVRIHDQYVFNLTTTKPIHHSQETIVDFGEHDGRCYGEIKMHVRQNPEFIGRLLQMGEAFEVMAPESLRQIVAEKVTRMNQHYQKTSTNK